jgi:AraC-like DNA-binding protein
MLDLISSLTSGVALTLGVILFYNPLGANKKGVRFLSFFFLLIFITNFFDELLISSIIDFLYKEEVIIFIIGFIPLFFYLSLYFFINPNNKFFASPRFFLLTFPILMFLGCFFNPAIVVAFFVINIIVITLLSLYEFNKFNKKILLFSSNTSSINLLWLKRTLFFIIIIAFNEILFALEFTFFDNFQMFSVLINIVCFILVGYNSLCQTEIYPADIINNQDELETMLDYITETEKNNDATPNLEEEKEKINAYLLMHKCYLEPNLNIGKLANELDTTIHKISFIINKGFQTNFNQFINSYRIEEAKKLLKNPNYQNYTIEAIAYEVGFNSKASFNITFKKTTGVTPSEFKMQ